MSKFAILTKYIPIIQKVYFDDWSENEGIAERTISVPFVDFSRMVHNFIDDVYTFAEQNKEMELARYGEILEENGIKWDMEAMKNADVSTKDAKCVLALIMGALRAERCCDGALLDFFQSGCILKWSERLNSIEQHF